MRLGIPHDVSLDGHIVDGVLGYLTLCTGFAFAVLVVVLAVTLLFHRARAGRQAHHTHGDGPGARLLTFGVGLTLFFAIDVTLAVRAAHHLRARFWNYPDDVPNALRVEVKRTVLAPAVRVALSVASSQVAQSPVPGNDRPAAMKDMGVTTKFKDMQKVTLFDGVFDPIDPEKYAMSFPVHSRV